MSGYVSKTGEQHFQDYLMYKEQNMPQGWGLSLISSAFAGYTLGERTLGECYLKGQMGSADYELARKWLEKAAAKEDARAIMILGTMTMYGRGFQTNGEKARELLEKAIELGEKEAYGYMGLSYELGIGQPVDMTTAVSWYEKGVRAEDAASMSYLAECLKAGKGIEKDAVRAAELQAKSEELGFESETK